MKDLSHEGRKKDLEDEGKGHGKGKDKGYCNGKDKSDKGKDEGGVVHAVGVIQSAPS
jgi:hypothetical protein